LEQSVLLRSIDDPEKYTIETVWGSREALEGGSLGTFFEAVGASPKMEIHEVIETIP
jgi:heme-degrading monooxygenase HmoA